MIVPAWGTPIILGSVTLEPLIKKRGVDIQLQGLGEDVEKIGCYEIP